MPALESAEGPGPLDGTPAPAGGGGSKRAGVPPGRGLRGALSFLTQVPIGLIGEVTPGDVGRGTLYFPLVGAALGGASAATAWLASLILPVWIAALIAVAVGAALTGALHLDGVADTLDSYGAGTRARALEVMRDHAVGSYGIVAVVLDLGLRTAAIAALIGRPHGLLYLVAAGALSRSAAVALGVLLPPARAHAGLTSVLEGVKPWRAIVAAAIGVLVAIACIGPAGIVLAAAGSALAALWGWHCIRRLGGMTGDTLGAASEGVELLVLVAGTAMR
jgi:adenosylcobinamide-GDP ribazoletransferase